MIGGDLMARPLIQLALDTLDIPQTLKLASLTAPYVDIFEIGTPSIKHNGIALVKEFKNASPTSCSWSTSKPWTPVNTKPPPSSPPAPTSPPSSASQDWPPSRASSTPPTSTTPRSRST
ncbi:protein of unknown function [Methylococcus capsulatus]|uniref:Orotidine 5'-phosphate decarboxylase domain-containing protein n=1 Tax=Methylococcus capsulatus TaxID=414 RepID=A0AA35UPU8_METCP|nr:protein of unknown function [Methylococcus capsulatus]